MKGLRAALGGVAKLRTEREDVELVVIGRPREGEHDSGRASTGSGWRRRALRHGMSDHELVEPLRRGPGRRRALALRGVLPPGDRGDGLRRRRRRHHRRGAARGRAERAG